MIKVALDAMGGDNAPGEIVKGAVDAVNTSKECFVYLVGKEDVVNNELSKYTYSKEQIEVVNATEVIETGEPPVMAIRHKKDSSLVKALNMVKNKEADAFVWMIRCLCPVFYLAKSFMYILCCLSDGFGK